MQKLREALDARVNEPAVRAAIDELVEDGVLPPHWTLDDVACVLTRADVAEALHEARGGVVDGDRAEQALFTARAVERDVKARWQAAWRADPCNLEREHAQRRLRNAQKKQADLLDERDRRVVEQRKRIAWLKEKRLQAKADRKRRISGVSALKGLARARVHSPWAQAHSASIA